MSGEDLRTAVIHNRIDVLRQYLIEKTNPCSGEEYGLNAMHYAVWNGHAECVRLLAMNPNGVDANGRRNSCLLTQSCMGYTALHIAALECPKKAIEDIVNVLLISGADPKITDEEGLTAFALAKENNNQAYLDVFQRYLEFRNGNLSPEDCDVYRTLAQVLKTKYILHQPKDPLTVPKELIAPPTDTQSLKSKMTKKSTTTTTSSTASTATNKSKTSKASTVVDELALVPTTIADFINRDNDHNQQRIAERPKDLLIPEEYINPISQIGFYRMKGIESIKTLKFMNSQAQKNMARREKLIHIGEEATGQAGSKEDNNNNNNPGTKLGKSLSPPNPTATTATTANSTPLLPNIHAKK